MTKKSIIQKNLKHSTEKPVKPRINSGNVINNFSDEFIQYTIKTWQPYFNNKLKRNDAIEITNNMIRLFTLLIDINQEERK